MNLTWGRISVSLLIVRLSLYNSHNMYMIINILAYTCVFMKKHIYIQTHDSDYIIYYVAVYHSYLFRKAACTYPIHVR